MAGEWNISRDVNPTLGKQLSWSSNWEGTDSWVLEGIWKNGTKKQIFIGFGKCRDGRRLGVA